MTPRPLDTLPVEIQDIILTEVVSNPYPDIKFTEYDQLDFGLLYLRVCSMYSVSFTYLMLL